MYCFWVSSVRSVSACAFLLWPFLGVLSVGRYGAALPFESFPFLLHPFPLSSPRIPPGHPCTHTGYSKGILGEVRNAWGGWTYSNRELFIRLSFRWGGFCFALHIEWAFTIFYRHRIAPRRPLLFSSICIFCVLLGGGNF